MFTTDTRKTVDVYKPKNVRIFNTEVKNDVIENESDRHQMSEIDHRYNKALCQNHVFDPNALNIKTSVQPRHNSVMPIYSRQQNDNSENKLEEINFGPSSLKL